LSDTADPQNLEIPVIGDDLHRIIDQGELRVEGRFVDASNATLFGMVSLDEKEHHVIYKPIAGERPLWDFPDGNLAQRERAAYLLSHELGLDLVPYTIVRDGPFGPGMVQRWIEIDERIDVIELAQSSHSRIRELALFDAIINNTDRKYGHILPQSEQSLYACDHGVTFHHEDKLRTVIWQFAGELFTDQEKELLIAARKLPATSFSSLISAKEIKALRRRIDSMLERSSFPEPSDDWPAVPWPPF